MNQKLIFKADILFGILILTFIGMYLSFAIPSNYRDVSRSPQWRMQHAWDEGQNVARAQSIVKYGYKENPIIPNDLNQFYLMLAAFGQRFFNSEYELSSRVALALRFGSTFSLCLCFLLFYFLCRMVSKPLSSFIAWVCFTSASWTYLPMGTAAKEDNFCVLITLCIIISFISIFKKPAAWKLYCCALLIGLGGATKQYPLILSLIFPMYFWVKGMKPKKLLVETLKMAFVVIFVALIVNPNTYLGHFQTGSPINDLLFGQQALPNLSAQLLSSWEIIKTIIVFRYREFYLALFLLIVAKLTSFSFKGVEAPAYKFIKKYKSYILLFLFLYYGISIYKQNYYASVRYFMVGEIVFFLLFAILIERLLQLKDLKVKAVTLGILFIEVSVLNLRRGNFNFALQVSSAEQALREANHSIYDDLESKLSKLSAEQRQKILSHWYVYIPAEYNAKYVHYIEFAYGLAEAYLTREYNISLLNAELNETLIQKEQPTLFLSLYPLHENNFSYSKCFVLIEKIQAMEPNLYSNYLTALFHFHKTRKSLNEGVDPYPLPAGSTVYAFDTRSCNSTVN